MVGGGGVQPGEDVSGYLDVHVLGALVERGGVGLTPSRALPGRSGPREDDRRRISTTLFLPLIVMLAWRLFTTESDDCAAVTYNGVLTSGAAIGVDLLLGAVRRLVKEDK